MKLLNWFKKNTFYKVLVIAVVLALAGYAVWFFQPMPIIPEGAENIQIDYTHYSSDKVESTEVQVVFYKWTDGDREDTHLIDLTEEGCRKLIELVKTQKIRAIWSVPGGSLGRPQGSFSFGVRFEYKGVGFLKWIYAMSDVSVTNNWYEIDPGAKPQLGPAANHDTKITGQTEADEFYAAVLDIIENYAATDRVIHNGPAE